MDESATDRMRNTRQRQAREEARHERRRQSRIRRVRTADETRALSAAAEKQPLRRVARDGGERRGVLM